MQPISFAILDGKNLAEHVRSDSWYPLLFRMSFAFTDMTAVNMAWYLVLDQPLNVAKPSTRKLHAAIALLVFTTVVFRSEVLLLLIPFVLQALFLRHSTYRSIVKLGIISGLVSLGWSLY